MVPEAPGPGDPCGAPPCRGTTTARYEGPYRSNCHNVHYRLGDQAPLTVPGRARLDALRADCAAHGWSELFGGTYPHAGGPDHTALFLENVEGFEVELVAP